MVQVLEGYSAFIRVGESRPQRSRQVVRTMVNGQWVDAGKLSVGDLVRRLDGSAGDGQLSNSARAAASSAGLTTEGYFGTPGTR